MKKNIVRVIAALPGVLMLANGIGFLAQPAQTAASLGMPYLEGMGRSTQVGDMASFFVAIAAMCFLGAWQRQPIWLYSAAMLLGGAALFRTLATLLHDAPFATVFIAVEVVLTLVLLGCARSFAAARG